MPTNPRVVSAYRAMRSLGISEKQVKPVLKKLLKLYDKNWELIEEENYRALADAIFDEEDNKGENVEEEAHEDDEPEPPLKRLRLRGQEGQSSQSANASAPSMGAVPLKKLKLEENASLETYSPRKPQRAAMPGDGHARTESISPQFGGVNKGKKAMLPEDGSKRRRLIALSALQAGHSKQQILGPGVLHSPKNKVTDSCTLIKPKDEPVDDDWSLYQRPISMILPGPSDTGNTMGKDVSKANPTSTQSRDGVAGNVIQASSDGGPNCAIAPVSEKDHSEIEIASSPLGEVKISLSCGAALGRPDFHMPSRDEAIKMLEDKCLRSYKILDPNFSVMKLLSDMCECFLELGTNSNDKSQEGLLETNVCGALNVMGSEEELDMPTCTSNETLNADCSVPLPSLTCNSNGPLNIQCSIPLPPLQIPSISTAMNGMDDSLLAIKNVKPTDGPESDGKKEQGDSISTEYSMVVVTPSNNMRSIHDVHDITKGEERVRIPWINNINSEFPPPFHYISQNIVYEGAHVNISLNQIAQDDCCSTCLGNCLLSSTPCACAHKTGGEFAYTLAGLVKDDFLNEYLEFSHNPQSHYFYCKYCPIERSKDDDCLEPCKGHLRRRFIKECWNKCGCNKQCGNRVLQQGITCKLQVFYTSEGKGWGLRTLEDLPKGAFICEFVGEIITNRELYERNMLCMTSGKCTCPVLLDADWDSGDIKDDEALSLDAASYGNIARFINHRCLDANLIEIPIEVESPKHHYYHLALFTSRKVAALEELTWDYGIDFDDQDHPIKMFECLCGSKFCRNMKRSKRFARSASTAR